MNKYSAVAIFVVGVALLIFGLNTSDSLASNVSSAVTGAPTEKTIWLVVAGFLGVMAGSLGLLRRKI